MRRSRAARLKIMLVAAGMMPLTALAQPAVPAPPASPTGPAPQAPAAPGGAPSAQQTPPPVASPAPAPAPSAAVPPPGERPTETPALVIDGNSADTLLGKPVLSPSGEDMGRIVDVITDRSGMLRAVIVDFGGFLGVGSRKIAVDWRVMHFPPGGTMDKLTVQLQRNQLRSAPVYKAGEPIVVVGRSESAGAPQAPAGPPPAPPAAGAAPAQPPVAATPPASVPPQPAPPAAEAAPPPAGEVQPKP